MQIWEDTAYQLPYKGCAIVATAVAMGDNRFTAHLCITRDAKRYTDETPFEPERMFATANEALEAALAVGKQLIDAGIQPTE
jgi:hypothetical protein